MSTQIGFRRVVELPNHRTYIRPEELLCPCCGHLTRVEFDQDYGDGSCFTMTHCLNESCDGHYMTRKVDAFFELYGQTKLQSKE
jgi:hypothetical protein